MPGHTPPKPLPCYDCCKIECLNGTMPLKKLALPIYFFVALGISGILFGLAEAFDENALYYAAGTCLGFALVIIMLDQNPCLRKMFRNNSQTT